MNVRRDCRSVIRTSTLFCLLLASTCAAAAEVDIIFAGDFLNSQPIQWVRRHGRAAGASIALGPAYVTATRLSGMGANLTIYLELPPELNGNSDYPQWSALKTFGSSSGGVPAVGDCVSVEGTIANFNGASELTGTVWIGTPGDCGTTPITPAVPGFVASVATDADPVTAGIQSGASAEGYESVLVQLNEVEVQSPYSGTGPFNIEDSTSGAGIYLSVAGFLYPYTPLAGTSIASITGILDEFDPDQTTKFYQLLPRSASDIVVN